MPSTPPIARVYGGRPVEQRQQARRERLMEAGQELFGTVGYRGTSVRAVLAHAQLSERYFGESFDGLRSLFQAVYDAALDRVLAKTIAAVQEADGGPLVEIRAGMEAFFVAITDDPRDARIMLVEIVAAGPALFDHGMSKLDIFSKFVAFRAGELGLKSSAIDLELLSSALVGAGNELLRQAVFGATPIPLSVAIDHAVFLYDATFQALSERQSE